MPVEEKRVKVIIKKPTELLSPKENAEGVKIVPVNPGEYNGIVTINPLRGAQSDSKNWIHIESINAGADYTYLRKHVDQSVAEVKDA